MKTIPKKAMSQFEIIGYAILAIVVIIVAIMIFTNLTKTPANSIDSITKSINNNQDSCVQNPATCNPLAAPSSTSPSTTPGGK